METGILVTAFYLFGMLGLVIFNASLEEPMQHEATQPRKARSKLRAPHYAADTRARKKAA